jgi:hypothetical protein
MRVKLAIVGLLAALGVWWLGAHHLAQGSNIATMAYPKDGWSVSDTFVDYDDFHAARESDAGRGGFGFAAGYRQARSGILSGRLCSSP